MVPKSNTHAASGIGTYDDMNAIARLCVAQRHCDVLRSNRGAYMKLYTATDLSFKVTNHVAPPVN